VLRPEESVLTDGQLLGAFIEHQDEAAFEVLLHRHGPMVLGVCRRILRNYHDAEDAFQATFLILLRKAATLTSREAVASWLYGVAYRTALKARAIAVQRRRRERPETERPEPAVCFRDPCESWQPLLDQEVNRLPLRYRLPLLLCDLEGKTRKEAARELGWPEGTVSGRLARARSLLARRLTRRGVALSGATLATLNLGPEAAAAVWRTALFRSTVKAAGLLAAGQGVAGGISAPVATLMEGVLKTMLFTKLKIAALALLGVIALCLGGLVYRTQAAPPAGQGPETAATEEPQRGTKAAPKSPPKDAGEDTGKSATKNVKVADFTTVEVQAPFQVDITQGDTFGASVTTDETLLDRVQVVKEGSVLKIALDSGEKGRQSSSATVLKATITMPALEGVNLRAASRARIKGFQSGKGFRARLNGASQLEGDIKAGKMDLQVAGASRVTLHGSATEVTLAAAGASRVALGDLATAKANVSLSGASRAAVQAKDQLDYTLSGASRLEYRGKPAIGKKSISGASTVSPK
jgi:RNA polymerase sigma factor (sigma-70 family)